MRKIDSLKREAMEACRFEEHRMSRFKDMGEDWGGGKCAQAVCLDCGKFVTVHTNPAPNGIDIHGEAVALGCED